MTITRDRIVIVSAILAVAGMVALANWRDARKPARAPLRPPVGTPGGLSTSRGDLDRAIDELRARLKDDPADVPAAPLLADALLRLSRVSGDSTLSLEAERVLTRALEYDSKHYRSRRMLAAIQLSQHRFADAVETARRASDMLPSDAWNHGAMGDAWLELGEYQKAFEAFDRMMQLRPSASAYARVAYAWEIKGDLREALKTMRMAAESTSAEDPEAQAWHYTQIGHLLQQLGRHNDARVEFQRALYTFPDYMLASIGLATLELVEGRTAEAMTAFQRLFDRKPTPEVAMYLGDVHRANGQTAEAERYYTIVETGWRFDTPEPVLLSRFLSERDRKLDDAALALAEQAKASRRDIFTEDALAWALFKKGRVAEALVASQAALRTGSRDRVILTHAAAIHEAAGHRAEARRLVSLALAGSPRFDSIVAPLAAAVQKRLNGDTPLLASTAR